MHHRKFENILFFLCLWDVSNIVVSFMFIIVLLVLAILPGLYAWRRLPFELMALFLFFLIYMGGVTALLGIGRYFILLVPVFLLFIAYVFSKIVEIKISKNLSN